MEWVLTIGALGLLCIFAEVFLPGGVLGVLGWVLIGTSLVAGYKLWGLSPPFLMLAAGFIAGAIMSRSRERKRWLERMGLLYPFCVPLALRRLMGSG